MSFEPITAILDIGGKLIDRLWPDPAQRDQAKLELLKMQQTGELAQLTAETELMKGQLAINTEEAKSSSIFVSGWRPFIGWVCGSAFALHFLFLPLFNFIAMQAGYPEVHITFDMSSLMTVLGGMLGLGGLRTVEKVKKVSS